MHILSFIVGEYPFTKINLDFFIYFGSTYNNRQDPVSHLLHNFYAY